MLFLAFLLCSTVSSNFFRETLLLRPLEDGKVLAHFQFDMASKNTDQHFTLFPKSMGQILARFKVQELEMTLTQGRWKFDRWGYPMPGVQMSAHEKNITMEEYDVTPHAGPVGAELVVWLEDEGEEKVVEENWSKLQHALAGIFCASFHQIGVKHTSRPLWAFKSGTRNQLRYGALPRENVCTENLTPWLKLLPCRNQAGLGMLLNSYKLFDGFHSLSAHVKPLLEGGEQVGWTLRQTIDVVLDPFVIAGSLGSPNWSLESLFGVQKAHACSVATQSSILLEISPWMQSKFPTLSSNITITAPSEIFNSGPNKVYLYRLSVNQGLNVEIKYSNPQTFSYAGLPFHSTPALLFDRYFAGRGQHFGKLVVDLRNSGSQNISVNYFDALPWFIKLFFHTLSITQNGKELNFRNDLHKFRFLPSKRHSSPTELEFEFDIPASSLVQITIEYEKAFLSMNDFPPDVSRGFDVQAGVVTILNTNKSVRLYTESLLIVLPSPDFSMPFNVIAFTSTLLAFFFGSLFNTLYSSPPEVLKRGRTTLGQRICTKLLTIANKVAKLKKRRTIKLATQEVVRDDAEPAETVVSEFEQQETKHHE